MLDTPPQDKLYRRLQVFNAGGGTACSGSAWIVAKRNDPDSKVYGANNGPTWVLSAPDGPHIGPMNLAIRGASADLPSSA